MKFLSCFFGYHPKGIFAALLIMMAGLFLFGCTTLTEAEQKRLLRLDEPAEKSDMTVEQLLAKMHSVTDPRNHLFDAKSYLLRQSTVSETEYKKGKLSEQYVSTVKFQLPDEMVQTTERAGTPVKTILFKDGDAYIIDPVSKKASRIPEGTELQKIKLYADIANPTKQITDIFAQVDVDVIYENHERYYRLICLAEDRAIPPYVIYVHSGTFLTAKAETIVQDSQGYQVLYIAESKDYKWVDDILIPTTTLLKVKNQTDVCTTTAFDLNCTLPGKDFELPSGYRISEE